MSEKVAGAAQPALLNPIEHLVIKAAKELGARRAYGQSIYKTIRKAYPSVAQGSVYSSIERSRFKGYLKGHKGDPDPKRGGRAKVFLEVTPLGEETLAFTHDIFSRPLGLRTKPVGPKPEVG